jgi:hypothetical protein
LQRSSDCWKAFAAKLDATLVQVDELTRSVDRREPIDLPPLPLALRAN